MAEDVTQRLSIGIEVGDARPNFVEPALFHSITTQSVQAYVNNADGVFRELLIGLDQLAHDIASLLSNRHIRPAHPAKGNSLIYLVNEVGVLGEPDLVREQKGLIAPVRAE